MQQFMSYVTGLAGLAVLWVVLLIATKKHPWSLVIGEDGQPSTSKFQMMVWTAAVVFAFLAIFQIRFANGYRGELPGLPQNLLIAMGISVVTTVSAKSIATKSAAAAAAAPPPLVPTGPSLSGIFCDDAGLPDLSKVQLVLWTVIGVGVFLAEVIAVVQNPNCPPFDPNKVPVPVCNLGLPDIGQTLMVLMGLGHGAYIGKKIADA
jgi:hypothetical protein